MNKPQIVRITTVPVSLDKLLGPQLEFINQHYKVIAVSADEKMLLKVAAKYGVKHHHVEMTRQMTPWQDLKALWHMYRFLKKEQPAIVHTHTPKAGTVGMLAAKLAGVPHRLHTVAGMPLMETTGWRRKILDIVEKITYTAATRVYPNSKGLHDFIVKNKYTAANRLKVLANGSSNGIDTDHFSPDQITETDRNDLRSRLNIKESDFVFVFIGRMVGHKGVNELVEAFTKVQFPQTSRPSAESESGAVKLILVGPSEEHLDPLAPETLQEMEQNPNIIHVGYQHDVRPYFAVSNALAFPSYREGFPNAVLQAGAMALPSIVTNINGCNEIIKDGLNGMIIPVKNANALAAAMQRMVSDETFCRKLQKNAREIICARYKQEIVWAALLNEYQSSLTSIPG